MAGQIDIPNNPQQIGDYSKTIARTVGGTVIRTGLYANGMPNAEANNKTDFKKQDYQITQGVISPDEGLSKSKQLGTVVLSNLVITPQSWVNQDGVTVNTFTNTITIDTVMFNVAMQKNIIETVVQGRSGTVKEYIADGDYTIDIRGVLTERNGVNVKQSIKELMEACKMQSSIKVQSWYLNEVFGINDIVIYFYDFPQQQGGYSTQQFQLQCKSDTPIELYLR